VHTGVRSSKGDGSWGHRDHVTACTFGYTATLRIFVPLATLSNEKTPGQDQLYISDSAEGTTKWRKTNETTAVWPKLEAKAQIRFSVTKMHNHFLSSGISN
jgi:hypothetical protein